MQGCYVGALSIRCVPRYPDSTHRRAMRSNAARMARIRVLLKVLAAIMLLPLLGSEAFASCTGSNRIWHNSAECLVAEWESKSWPQTSWFRVSSTCSSFGKVVAKVDIKNASDRTLHLTNSNNRDGSTSNPIRGIYCCKDVGDLCNYPDLVNPQGCVDQFRKSPAKETCNLYELPTISDARTQCNFKAWCLFDHGNWSGKSTLNLVLWYKADEMINCNGVLSREGSC